MAAKRYLKLSGGLPAEQAATVVSAGVGNAGDLVALDDAGRLDESVMPVGVAADVAVLEASEALAAGDFVNIWNSAGAKVRKADASAAGKEAHGFVLAAVASGANASVYFEGTNTQVSGQTPGRVFLSAATPGQAAAAAPSGAGQVAQSLGFAVSATAINFQSGAPILIA